MRSHALAISREGPSMSCKDVTQANRLPMLKMSHARDDDVGGLLGLLRKRRDQLTQLHCDFIGAVLHIEPERRGDQVVPGTPKVDLLSQDPVPFAHEAL